MAYTLNPFTGNFDQTQIGTYLTSADGSIYLVTVTNGGTLGTTLISGPPAGTSGQSIGLFPLTITYT